MSLSLSYERCVRTRAVEAACRACVDACPVDAVTLEGPKQAVAVDLDACTACALCAAACPTEAFSGVFDVRALPAGTRRVACGEAGVPCVAALATEDLVALAVRAGALELVGRACPGHHGALEGRLAEARRFLEALGLTATLSWRDETPPRAATPAPAPPPPPEPPAPIPPRRQFIGLFVPRALPPQPPPRQGRLTQPERLDVKRLREPAVPARRARLLAALPSSVAPRVPRLPAAALGFTSSKVVSAQKCTGCMRCVTACPTGALTSSRLKEQLRFDGSRCVKCGLCHDVCEPKAITLAADTALTDFLDFAPRTLATLPMIQCGECGGLFKDEGLEPVLCPRCRAMDDEARGLRRLT